VDHPHPATAHGGQLGCTVAAQRQTATADKLHVTLRIMPTTVGHAIEMMNQVFQCRRLKPFTAWACMETGRKDWVLGIGAVHALSVTGWDKPQQ
jgi:hypothetical protein